MLYLTLVAYFAFVVDFLLWKLLWLLLSIFARSHRQLLPQRLAESHANLVAFKPISKQTTLCKQFR